MSECQTKPLLPEFSGCLVENPSCQHAVRFGFSYLCKHPNHLNFITATTPHIEITTQYMNLRESRRHSYIAEINKSIEVPVQ